MPKPKPDQVVRHEIVLGRSERDLLEGALVAYQINRISTPLVALLSDVSAMTIVFTALGTYLGFKFEVFQGGYADMTSLVNDFINQYEAFKESNTVDQAATVVGAGLGAIPGAGVGLQALFNAIFGNVSQYQYESQGGGGGSF